MAQRYVSEIRHVQAVGPYHLGGWSLGALIAFEMAQQLRGMGEQVTLLALLEGTPGIEIQAGSITEEEIRSAEEERLAESIRGLREPPEEPNCLPYADRLHQYLCCAQREMKVPSEIDEGQLDRFWRIQVLSERIARRYQCKPYPGRIALLRSRVSEAPDRTYGWDRFANDGVEVYEFEETHQHFVSEPNAKDIAARLMELISISKASMTEPDQSPSSEHQSHAVPKSYRLLVGLSTEPWKERSRLFLRFR